MCGCSYREGGRGGACGCGQQGGIIKRSTAAEDPIQEEVDDATESQQGTTLEADDRLPECWQQEGHNAGLHPNGVMAAAQWEDCERINEDAESCRRHQRMPLFAAAAGEKCAACLAAYVSSNEPELYENLDVPPTL